MIKVSSNLLDDNVHIQARRQMVLPNSGLIENTTALSCTEDWPERCCNNSKIDHCKKSEVFDKKENIVGSEIDDDSEQ